MASKIIASKYDNLFGIYVWELPDGRVLQDEDGNTLSISSKFGDVIRMSRLASAARSYGFNEGRPLYMSGVRKISDEEFENQKERMSSGLIPDDHDLSAYEETFAARKINGR